MATRTTAQEVVGEYTKESHICWIEFSKQFLLEDAKVEPIVSLALNDNWMEFTLRYVVDFKVRRSTKDKLFTGILDGFEKTEGNVKIASTTLQMVDPSAFEVHISSDKYKKLEMF